MSLRAATALVPGSVLEAEVAIVGSGPAGLALATALTASGRDVVLLEAGELGVPAGSAAGDSPLFAAGERAVTFRNDRRFGGTRWYGRCVAPDRVDFEARAWVPGSGWPIRPEEVESRLERAASWLGIGRTSAFAPVFWEREPAWRLLDGDGLSPRVHLFSPAGDLGRRFRRPVADDARLRALLGATMVGLDLAPKNGCVERARFVGGDGAERAVRARQFVLACGGLENVRQLLLLDEAAPGRLGASTASLGRGFFDHPRCDGVARLYLDPAAQNAGALFRRLVERRSRRAAGRVQVAAGIAPELQRSERLLNPCGFFYPVSLLRLAALAGAGSGLPLALAALAARALGRSHRSAPLALVEQLEQAPAEAGSVELAAERDRFGRRRLRVHWSVGEETRRTQRRFHQLLAARLTATGAGRLESPMLDDPEFRPDYGDAAHPMGTTRMSIDPGQGVVNRDCRLHALENLWVAGSSVFPTSGNANPTLTLVALALRLADHLSARGGAANR